MESIDDADRMRIWRQFVVQPERQLCRFFSGFGSGSVFIFYLILDWSYTCHEANQRAMRWNTQHHKLIFEQKTIFGWRWGFLCKTMGNVVLHWEFHWLFDYPTWFFFKSFNKSICHWLTNSRSCIKSFKNTSPMDKMNGIFTSITQQLNSIRCGSLSSFSWVFYVFRIWILKHVLII